MSRTASDPRSDLHQINSGTSQPVSSDQFERAVDKMRFHQKDWRVISREETKEQLLAALEVLGEVCDGAQAAVCCKWKQHYVQLLTAYGRRGELLQAWLAGKASQHPTHDLARRTRTELGEDAL